jgi:hypothetical protein
MTLGISRIEFVYRVIARGTLGPTENGVTRRQNAFTEVLHAFTNFAMRELNDSIWTGSAILGNGGHCRHDRPNRTSAQFGQTVWTAALARC